MNEPFLFFFCLKDPCAQNFVQSNANLCLFFGHGSIQFIRNIRNMETAWSGMRQYCDYRQEPFSRRLYNRSVSACKTTNRALMCPGFGCNLIAPKKEAEALRMRGRH